MQRCTGPHLCYTLLVLLFIVCADLLSVLVYRDLVLLSRVNRRLTKGTKYPRMEDPAKGVTRKGTSLLRYLHADGSSCPPFSANTASERTLAMGATRLPTKSPSPTRRETTPPHSFLATIAFFVERVALIGDIRNSMFSNKQKAVARTLSPPEKPTQ